MTTRSLFSRLNLKEQSTLHILHAPSELRDALIPTPDRLIKTTLEGTKKAEFVLYFATRKADVDALATSLAGMLDDDALFWIAYPKQSSKRYTCDFHRDTGWASIGKAGYEPVRQIAINEDWSALRFRRPAHIRTMTRSFAMTAEGQARVTAAAMSKGESKRTSKDRQPTLARTRKSAAKP